MIYDVLIIGGGVIGGMLARELSRYDHTVCLLEKEQDVAMGASKANSGIIHGGYDPEPGTLKAQLNTAGVELLFQAARELNVPHVQNGSMVCAFSAEEEPQLKMLYRRGLENNIPNLSILSGDAARALEPELSSAVTKVLYVPDAGIVCPYSLTVAAIGNAMDNGVALKCGFGVSAMDHGDVFTLYSAAGEVVQGRYVVNCAGACSDRIARLAGDDFFTIIPRAGEYMLLDKAEGSRVRHTLFQCPTKEGKGILVSPTVHGNLLAGPTAARVLTAESRDTTPEGLDTVAKFAAKSVPGINFRQVITSFTGIRASEQGGDFILQPSASVPGLIHAGAVDSPGLTCCVSIARYLVKLLADQGLALTPKKSWDGSRGDPHFFGKLSPREQDAFIKRDPAYGRIVCRCETVSEGEILHAIRTNPPARDLDAVKRRTRSGMGRCQGGFCGPYVMELLARELHIPLEAVTKSGGQSVMVAGRLGEKA